MQILEKGALKAAEAGAPASPSKVAKRDGVYRAKEPRTTFRNRGYSHHAKEYDGRRSNKLRIRERKNRGDRRRRPQTDPEDQETKERTTLLAADDATSYESPRCRRRTLTRETERRGGRVEGEDALSPKRKGNDGEREIFVKGRGRFL